MAKTKLFLFSIMETLNDAQCIPKKHSSCRDHFGTFVRKYILLFHSYAIHTSAQQSFNIGLVLGFPRGCHRLPRSYPSTLLQNNTQISSVSLFSHHYPLSKLHSLSSLRTVESFSACIQRQTVTPVAASVCQMQPSPPSSSMGALALKRL